MLSKFPLNSKSTGVSVLQLDSAALTQINIVTATLSPQPMPSEILPEQEGKTLNW